jgi:hypothetical protein
MSADEIQFPKWMPSDAQDTCIDILSAVRSVNFPQARDVLERLATRLAPGTEGTAAALYTSRHRRQRHLQRVRGRTMGSGQGEEVLCLSVPQQLRLGNIIRFSAQ